MGDEGGAGGRGARQDLDVSPGGGEEAEAAAVGDGETDREGAVESAVGAESETAGPYPVTKLAVVAQRELRRIRRYDRGRGGGGAIQKDGGEREGGARHELAVGPVGGEEAEAAAAESNEVDGHRGGVVQQGATEGRGDTEDPGAGGGVGIPGTGSTALQLQVREGATGSIERDGESPVEGAIGTEPNIARSHAIAELAVVAQRERRRRRQHLDDRVGGGGGAVGKDGGHGERCPGDELAVRVVGGEETKPGAVGDGKVDGHRDGVMMAPSLKR